MPISTLTFTQLGYTPAGPVWVDLTPFSVLGLSTVGFTAGRWTVSPKSVLPTTLTLTLSYLTGSGTGTASVYTVRENSCTAFSTAQLPLNRRLELAGTATGPLTVADESLVIQLALNTAVTGQARETRSILSFGADPNQIGLVVGWTGTDVTVVPAVALDYQDAFTGLEGPWRALGRADHCPKCGLPSTRDTWVRDRFSDKMTCKACYDPLSYDDVDRRTAVGREREGLGEG